MEKKKNILFRYYDCLLGKPKELTETSKVSRKIAFLNNNHLLKNVMREKEKKKLSIALWVELLSSERYVEVLTPRTCECDFNRK